MKLKLTASNAFGDGNHPTTQGMMRMMHECAQEHEGTIHTILDMGCGSGILSILAAQLFPNATILAADIEEEAVQVTMQHAQMNGVSDQMRAVRSDGFSHPEIQASAPFDLILANMLAEPLMRCANDMANALKPEGIVMISGVLDWQEGQIREAYERAGLQGVHALQVEEWLSILFVR